VKWVSLEKDTACEWCLYTIRAADEEGMFFAYGHYFCMENCYEQWAEFTWSSIE